MATQAVLSERVCLAEDLLQRAQRLIGAEGHVKLCNKLKSEIKFLRRATTHHLKGAHVYSSNLTQLSAVVQSAESLSSVVALLRVYTFTDEKQNKKSLTVDVVSDGGLLWVKAVGRKAEALHAVWQGRGQFGDRSVIGQAREFLLAASQHPLHYTCPRILFAFYNGVPRPIADELQRLGVSVSGEVVGVRGPEPEDELQEEEPQEDEPEEAQSEGRGQCSALKPLPSQPHPSDLLQFYQYRDSGSDSDQGPDQESDQESDHDSDKDSDSDQDQVSGSSLDRSQVVSRLAFPAPAAPPACARVNLDVSTLLSLVSALTHGGCGLVFREAVLTEQAAAERRTPVLPALEAFLSGKELVACTSAVVDFREILRTLGGAKEKERADSLLRRVAVVTDQPSPRALALAPSAAISPRSVAIFGTGDALRAVTMTANRKFVRAAANQGVHFSVFIHEPRALTEGKEWRATPAQD